jgi:hypothetical protein
LLVLKHDVENVVDLFELVPPFPSTIVVGFDDDGDDTGIGLLCVTAAAGAAAIFPEVAVAVTLFFDGDGETMLGFVLVPDGAETL